MPIQYNTKLFITLSPHTWQHETYTSIFTNTYYRGMNKQSVSNRVLVCFVGKKKKKKKKKKNTKKIINIKEIMLMCPNTSSNGLDPRDSCTGSLMANNSECMPS